MMISRRSQNAVADMNRGPVQTDIDAIFVEIVGKIDMNKIAEGGSVLLDDGQPFIDREPRIFNF